MFNSEEEYNAAMQAEAEHDMEMAAQAAEGEAEQERINDEAVNSALNTLLAMPKRVVDMCAKRNWNMHWTSRGVYLHLESSELIEAIRGKHGDPEEEAADVLLVLMSITETAGIAFDKVIKQATKKLEYLENAPPYAHEERG